MALAQCKFNSPVGELFLEASEKGLSGIYFSRQASRITKEDSLEKPQAKILNEAREQLKQYFSGKLATNSLGERKARLVMISCRTR